MATASEVDRTLRALVGRLEEVDAAERASAFPDRTFVCHVADLGIAYRGAYRAGRIEGLERAEEESANGDVRVSLTSDDLVALAEGRLPVMRAFLTGRLRVSAGLRDLVLLRAIFR